MGEHAILPYEGRGNGISREAGQSVGRHCWLLALCPLVFLGTELDFSPLGKHESTSKSVRNLIWFILFVIISCFLLVTGLEVDMWLSSGRRGMKASLWVAFGKTFLQ